MKARHYGALPVHMSNHEIEVKESMFYLYLPIKMAGSAQIHLPKRLQPFYRLVREVIRDMAKYLSFEERMAAYIYITAKHMYVGAGVPGNRPGYHSDGFLTDDINYIWCDNNPTVFNTSQFSLTQDDQISLREMEDQAKATNEVQFFPGAFLKLDQFVIHRVPEIEEGCMRTFVKISVSKGQV